MRHVLIPFFFLFLFLNSELCYSQDVICAGSASPKKSLEKDFKLKDLVAKHQKYGPRSWLSEDLEFVNDFGPQFNFMLSSLEKSISSKNYPDLLIKEFESFSGLLRLKKNFPLRYEEMMNLSFHFVVLNDLKYLPETTSDLSKIGDYISLNVAELKASYEEVVEVANEIGFELKFLPYHRPVGYETLSRSFVAGMGLLLLTDVRSMVDTIDMPPSLALRHDFDHFFSSVDLTMGALLGLADVNFKTRYVGSLESRKQIWDEMHGAFLRFFEKVDQVKNQQERDRIEVLFFYLVHEHNFYFPKAMLKFAFKKLMFGIEGDMLINLLHYDSTEFDFPKIIRMMEKEIPEKHKGEFEEWEDAIEFICENFAPEIDEAFDLDRNWKRDIPTTLSGS
ncbi:MAG: hypothetical protein VX642_08785 [Bdellovibrionota bacterium]|nr:hypothetical protein [Bdellovibrionota bacterium]